jgi:hypothetical protein
MGLSQLIEEGKKKLVGYSVASGNGSVIKEDENIIPMTQEEKGPAEEEKAEESDEVSGPSVKY